MSNRIRVEWVENGKPKQMTVDTMIYQLRSGGWDIAPNVVRIVLAKEGGASIVKAFIRHEPTVFERRELRRQRRATWLLSSVLGCAITLIAIGLLFLL